MNESKLGIYVHVPYCRVACPYCDFVKKPIVGAVPSGFAGAVAEEIRSFEGPDVAGSIFLGGGTPSLLEIESLKVIFDAARERFGLVEAEVSIEANPDDVTEDVLSQWRNLGVTRVNLGVQSFDDRVLRYLGRYHDADRARWACEMVAARFENWGIDLIFGAPPVAAWDATLSECLSFDPPHVSTYGLTYEEKTPFWKRRHEALDGDSSLELYRRGIEMLGAYEHYEVSNFAKEGFHSVHNQIYWRNEEYAGFGPGAYSFVNGVRARNSTKINAYVEKPGEKVEELQLSDLEIRVETLIQHFRTRRGLSLEAYRARFGRSMEQDFGKTLSTLDERGLLVNDGAFYRPTCAGYELNDEIGLALVE